MGIVKKKYKRSDGIIYKNGRLDSRGIPLIDLSPPLILRGSPFNYTNWYNISEGYHIQRTWLAMAAGYFVFM